MNHYLRRARLALLPLVLCGAAVLAQEDGAELEAALDRYLAIVPMSVMLDGTIEELAQQLPPHQRDEFVSLMKEIVRADRLELIARESMRAVFTADELNALADFYGSAHGSSAMSASLAPTWHWLCPRSKPR